MFDGEWTARAVTFGGTAMEAPEQVWRIDGERYVMRRPDGENDEGRLEAREGEGAVDVVCERGRGAGLVLRALLRRRGDWLQLCYHAEPGAARPTAFVSEAGTTLVLVRYRRLVRG